MAQITGKNKLETGFIIWVDDSGGTPRDLSGDLVPGSLTGGGSKGDEIDLTGVSDTVKNALAGHRDARISCQFYMNDTADTGASTVINGNLNGSGTVTLQYGDSGQTPEAGNLEWEGEHVYLGGDCGFSSGKGVINCLFVPKAGEAAPAWGVYA